MVRYKNPSPPDRWRDRQVGQHGLLTLDVDDGESLAPERGVDRQPRATVRRPGRAGASSPPSGHDLFLLPQVAANLKPADDSTHQQFPP
jgi:hypothetical protein